MSIREGLLAEFDHEMAATSRLLACVPDDRLGWKPHPRSRSIAALAAHMTEITGWSEQILEHARHELNGSLTPPHEPASRVALLAQFAEAAALARTRLDRSDADLTMLWSLRQDGRELFSLPRAAAFRTFVLSHVVHHRGQLSVYLRLNDVPVPPIYGPTADSHEPKPIKD